MKNKHAGMSGFQSSVSLFALLEAVSGQVPQGGIGAFPSKQRRKQRATSKPCNGQGQGIDGAADRAVAD